jgi:hypothetical protein
MRGHSLNNNFSSRGNGRMNTAYENYLIAA